MDSEKINNEIGRTIANLKASVENSNAWKIAGGVFAALSFVLYVSAFPPFDSAFSAYVFAIPACIVAYMKSLSLRAWNVITFIFTYVAWFVLLIWIRHLDQPFGWVSAFLLPLVVAGFVWPWFWALYSYMPSNVDSVCTRGGKILFLACLWVALEWLRSWLFTGFPWLLLAHSQWRMCANISLASVGGAYMVSFIIIFFNLALAWYCINFYLSQKARLRGMRPDSFGASRFVPEFYAALIMIFVGAWTYIARMPGPSDFSGYLRVGFVQPDFAGILKWNRNLASENFRVVERLSKALKNVRPDLICLPEAATPPSFPMFFISGLEKYFENISKQTNASLLFGSMAYFQDPLDKEGKSAYGDGGYSQNCAFAVSPELGMESNFYAKSHLVPFGEYVPKWCAWAIDSVVPVGGIKPGDTDTLLDLKIGGSQMKTGVMICYEDIFPSAGARLARNGAKLLFVCTNDSWYGREAGAWQHAAHSALQAVSAGLPLVRASNNGLSCAFDKFGKMAPAVALRGVDGKIYDASENVGVSELPDMSDADGRQLNPYNLLPLKSSPLVNDSGSIYFRGAGWADLPIYKNYKPTLYALYGDWFAYSCVLFVVVFLISRVFFANKNAGVASYKNA